MILKKFWTMKIKEYFLNTPETYWTVVFHRHLHKSLLGLLLIVLGVMFFSKTSWYLIFVGLFFVFLSVAGHIYTNNKPYLKLWDYYPKAKFKLFWWEMK